MAMIGIGLAVMNPATPFWVFIVLALLAGFALPGERRRALWIPPLLAIAILLVTLVVYLFLRDVRSTMIPFVAVPVSIIGTSSFRAASS